MPDEGVGKVLWWFGLVVAPAALIGIELFHPAHFTSPPGPGMYQYLSKPEPYNPGFVALSYPGPDWWFLLHSRSLCSYLHLAVQGSKRR